MNNKFNFFVPIELEKGSSVAAGEMKIKGICSSVAEDSDGEVLLPDGFDFQPLLESGFLNYNHQANKSASAIIGEPTVARVVNGGKDFYIEGFLYPESDEAKAVYKLASTLEKNSKTRRLGFSIEGQAIERDPFNTKRITRAKITGVAITACPKNPNTLMSIMKGEYAEPFIENEEVEKSELSSRGLMTCPKCDHPQMNPETGICMNCGHTEKAMTAAGGVGITDIEDVDGVPRSLITNLPLKKSEIYLQIVKQYPAIDLEKAKQIYGFVEQVNKKFFGMATINPSQDAIDKSFAILGEQMDLINKGEQAEEITPAAEATAEPIVKSQEAEPVTAAAIVKSDDGSDDDDDDVIKGMACDMAKKRIDKGMSSDDCVADMVKKGLSLEVAQTTVEKIIAEANALKEGTIAGGAAPASTSQNQGLSEASDAKIDGLVQVAGTFAKSEDVQAIGASVEALFKSQNDELSRRFGALGAIYKAQSEENNDLRKSLGEMVDTVRDMALKIARIENTPLPRKAVQTAAQVERFVKSQDGTIQVSVSDKNQMKGLNDQLFGQLDLIKSKGGSDALLEQAIGQIEIAGGLDERIIQQLNPRLRAMNIELVA